VFDISASDANGVLVKVGIVVKLFRSFPFLVAVVIVVVVVVAVDGGTPARHSLLNGFPLFAVGSGARIGSGPRGWMGKRVDEFDGHVGGIEFPGFGFVVVMVVAMKGSAVTRLSNDVQGDDMSVEKEGCGDFFPLESFSLVWVFDE